MGKKARNAFKRTFLNKAVFGIFIFLIICNYSTNVLLMLKGKRWKENSNGVGL